MSNLEDYEMYTGDLAGDAGFTRARVYAPFDPAFDGRGSPSLLLIALSYGNQQEEPWSIPEYAALIAPFARRNYYREAVKRLQELAKQLRARFGGIRSDFRIFCNSRIPERPLAIAAGLGSLGRNGLLITDEAGSLCIIAAMTLPYALKGDAPVDKALTNDFPRCAACDPKRPPCMAACPTGALRGDGTLDRLRCIQWYASGNEETVPPDVARVWGQRLYGCTLCQDACIHNQRPIQGVSSKLGVLPAYLDARELLSMSDEAIKACFKGTALGLSWLGPKTIRRNASLALRRTGFC
ncbi:MAG: iron-sulfur protein [Treponema sp.]|jgi:epoxyqueuosine reductase|nr:iron-sulfur protein [Treponema sp.]